MFQINDNVDISNSPKSLRHLPHELRLGGDVVEDGLLLLVALLLLLLLLLVLLLQGGSSKSDLLFESRPRCILVTEPRIFGRGRGLQRSVSLCAGLVGLELQRGLTPPSIFLLFNSFAIFQLSLLSHRLVEVIRVGITGLWSSCFLQN